MTAGVITISGRKYAAGLYWQPSQDRDLASSARQMAKQPGFQADYFCVRKPTKLQPVGQFGLGVSSAGHRAGMPSIAAQVASTQPGSWAGAFRVTEGIYFICIRDDLIDSEGDAWFSHDDDAHTRLEQEIARGGLSAIYCPNEWGVPSSDHLQITTLLSGRADTLLQDVGVPKSLVYGFFALLLIGAVGFAGYTYWQHLEEKRMADEAAAAAAQAAMQNVTVSQIEYPKVWQDAPQPMDYLNACEQALAKLQATYLGWTVSMLKCSATDLSASWTRAGQQHAVVPADGKATLDAALTNAGTAVPLENLRPRGPEALAHYGLIDETILHHNWPVALAPIQDDVVQVAEGQTPPPPPAWRKRSIVYTLSTAPWLRPDLFDKIPGLIITSVTKSDANYTVEGVIYENKAP